MQFDFKGLRIEHEKDLVRLVKEINSDIEFENITRSKKDKEELLDLDYVIKRYKRACQLKCVSFLFPLVFKGCSVDGADRYSGHF